jgi:uncharacterized SAM-binding protein YcdF (DUF218 family)
MALALVKQYTGRRLTWLSWLLILLLLTAGFFLFLINLYPFLSPEKQPHSGVMVVEGWIHDFALDEAVAIYRNGDYSKIVCTGVPIETGSYIQQFKSYPEMTAARLGKLGIPEDEIIITVADDSTRDRTFQAAVAMREGIIAYNIDTENLHIITVGPHGRRSRMLFQKALGDGYRIGVTCLNESTYDAANWYNSSEGVRAVIGEFLAYTYAKLFFHP